MNPSLIAKLSALALGFACGVHAEVAAPAQPTKAAEAPKAADAPKAAEAPKDAKKVEDNKPKVEFKDEIRQVVAYYSNASQARLKLYAVNRYDSEIAKPRVYFMAEMTGVSVVEPVKIDADDAASISELVKVLERFESEAKKSDKLKESMVKKKAAVESELSREETKLVDLQSNQSASADEVSSVKKQIEKLKADLVLSDELSKMDRISGSIGKVKINLERPAYEFIASFEPAKQLYTLKAGYSFQVDSKHAKFYIDLLKHIPEYKQQLLDHEKKTVLLRDAVNGIFKEETKN